MGRVLRRHGDQEPHFHHFIAVPEEDDHIAGLDDKQYVQQRHWVRELGEKIGEQPTIDEANVDEDLLARAEERGTELWAQDLLADLEVETVHGSVRLDEIVEGLTASAVQTLLDTVDYERDAVVESDWETAMTRLREDDTLSPDALQRTWWLFPVYREQPDELETLLREVKDHHEDTEASTTTAAGSDDDATASAPTTSTTGTINGTSTTNTPGPTGGVEQQPSADEETTRSTPVSRDGDVRADSGSDPQSGHTTDDEQDVVSRIRDFF
jgi:hypothetical protein